MVFMGAPWGPGSPGPPWHQKTNTEAKNSNTEAKKNNTEAKKPIQKLKKQIPDGIHGSPLGPWEPWAPLAPKNKYRS